MHHLLILALSLCVVSAAKVHDRLRILNGSPINIEKVPYQVSLIEAGLGHVCGASIISKDYVLTAGHCADSPPEKYSVRVGSTFSDRGGEIHNVTKVIRHEDFHEEPGVHRPVNDIALMKVKPQIIFDGKTKLPIKLFKKGELKIGDVGLLAGWGKTEKTNGAASKHLMSVNLTVVDYKVCEKNFQFLDGDMPINNFCARHPSGEKNSCQGDSGGPLVIKDKQAGIVSWGAPWDCTLFGLPSVYLDVAKYRTWINRHVKLHSKL